MHRQSLGPSPSSKHHLFTTTTTAAIISDDITSSSSSSSSSEAEECKSQKPYKITVTCSSSKLIHLIPILTFLCFFILYLSSHDPSRTDLAQFNRFSAFSSKEKLAIDSIEIDDDSIEGRLMKNDVIAIRGMRNLQQEERRRLHRKFGQ